MEYIDTYNGIVYSYDHAQRALIANSDIIATNINYDDAIQLMLNLTGRA